jgi:hypothetical protein
MTALASDLEAEVIIVQMARVISRLGMAWLASAATRTSLYRTAGYLPEEIDAFDRKAVQREFVRRNMGPIDV